MAILPLSSVTATRPLPQLFDLALVKMMMMMIMKATEFSHQALLCVYVSLCACVHVCAYECVHIYACHICACQWMCTNACMCVCAHIYMSMCICVWDK